MNLESLMLSETHQGQIPHSLIYNVAPRKPELTDAENRLVVVGRGRGRRWMKWDEKKKKLGILCQRSEPRSPEAQSRVLFRPYHQLCQPPGKQHSCGTIQSLMLLCIYAYLHPYRYYLNIYCNVYIKICFINMGHSSRCCKYKNNILTDIF